MKLHGIKNYFFGSFLSFFRIYINYPFVHFSISFVLFISHLNLLCWRIGVNKRIGMMEFLECVVIVINQRQLDTPLTEVISLFLLNTSHGHRK